MATDWRAAMQSNEPNASPDDDVREELANTLSKVFGYGPLAPRYIRERADAILAHFLVRSRQGVADAVLEREDAWEEWAREGAFDYDSLMRVQRSAFLAGFDAHEEKAAWKVQPVPITASPKAVEYEYTGRQMDGSPDTEGIRMWGSGKPDAAFRRVKAGPWEPNPAARA